jgi:hypothetical protein
MGEPVSGRAIAVGWTWPIAGVALWLLAGAARAAILGPGLPL